MNKKVIAAGLFALVMGGFFVACTLPINTNNHARFTQDGYFVPDSSAIQESTENPLSQVKFYVEVSGSMNGFFRANKQTHFKRDMWEICNYYNPISRGLTTLTNDGDEGKVYPLESFRTQMNTGAFVSTSSTKVPLMLHSILSKLNADKGEVAVLISDMKYSPVGAPAPDVLMDQYSTDISSVLGNFGKSVSLICASSNYVDRYGKNVTDRSPYYYFIMGNTKAVAEIRDGISTLLDQQKRFVDNIDSGFDFAAPAYTFGIPNKCYQLEKEPTFIEYEEADELDTCSIKLKVDLKPYRWIMTKKDYFEQALAIKPLYGSKVKVGKIDIESKNITDKALNRTAVATVELLVYDMPSDSEVLEWSLQLPDTDYSLFAEFCGAKSESDYTKSYSIEAFLRGIFYGGVVNKSLKPNYILISKNK